MFSQRFYPMQLKASTVEFFQSADVQVTSLHRWKKQGINHRFSWNTTHRQSLHLQAILTGETLEG